VLRAHRNDPSTFSMDQQQQPPYLLSRRQRQRREKKEKRNKKFLERMKKAWILRI
jgi:hypothetical protein